MLACPYHLQRVYVYGFSLPNFDIKHWLLKGVYVVGTVLTPSGHLAGVLGNLSQASLSFG